MKLIVTYEKPLEGKQRLFPRDIRNYLNSIVDESEKDLKDMVAWHERKTAPFIYSMPNRKSFAVMTYKSDKKTKDAFKRLVELINENNQISFKTNNINTKVKEAYIAKFDYTKFQTGFYERELRTPMVIATSKQDYAKSRELSKDGKIDNDKLQELVVDAIKQSIIASNRDWFREDVEGMLDDIMILCKDLKYFPMKYKDNEWYPAIQGTIVSNVYLPEFVGYKIGLGYGELMRNKEMQKRGK